MKILKKHKLHKPLYFLLCLIIFSCGKVDPEKYFGIAVLNTNMLFGFAGDGFSRQLESSSSKLSGENFETVPMKRREVIDMKTQFIEEAFEKVQGLSETPDTKDMIQSSLALYEFVLPVLKNDYVQLAEFYDNNAPQDQTESLTRSINEKYHAGFTERYNDLITKGKAYAEKNSIKVNWGVY